MSLRTNAANIPTFDPNKYGKPGAPPKDPVSAIPIDPVKSQPQDEPQVTFTAAIPADTKVRPSEHCLIQSTSSVLTAEPSQSTTASVQQPRMTSRTSSMASSMDKSVGAEPTIYKQQMPIVSGAGMKTKHWDAQQALVEAATNARGDDIRSPYSEAVPETPKPKTAGRPHTGHNNTRAMALSQVNPNTRNPRGLKARATPHQAYETDDEKLARLSRQGLNAIGRRNKHRDPDQTASPATLSFIRLPLAPGLEQQVDSRVEHFSRVGGSPLPSPLPAHSFHATSSEISLSGAGKNRVIQNNIGNATPPSGSLAPTRSTLTAKAPRPAATRPKSPAEPDPFVPSHARDVTPQRNPHWATTAEIRPDDVSVDSNAWGSRGLDDSTTSGDSMQAIHDGNARKKLDRTRPQASLVGWDGKMQPPPIDWNDRPRFDNNAPEFKNSFDQWTDAVVEFVTQDSPDLRFDEIPQATVLDVSKHADGLGMVGRTHHITGKNAHTYGYGADIAELARQEAKPLTRDEMLCVDKVDVDDPSNEVILEETTEMVVQRFLAHSRITAQQLSDTEEQSAEPPKPKDMQTHQATGNNNTPELNVYLRPACRNDIRQMTRIYNWYIDNSSKPTERDQITDADMRQRYDIVTEAKFPFIVAVEKTRNPKASKRTTRALQNPHPVQNTNPNYNGMVEEERIVGWACAQDFTFAEFVERISAELEIYVAPEVRRHGVGRRLLDKLIDATDRGYLKRGGYSFHCASEQMHLYETGGGRELHKLYFVLRKFSVPRKRSQHVKKGVNGESNGNSGAHGDLKQLESREDDSVEWLRDWLQTFGFKVEGMLMEAGAKDGR